MSVFALVGYYLGVFIVWHGYLPKSSSLVGCDTRIHRLHLCKRVGPVHNECPGYDTKLSDGKAPVMLEALGNEEHRFIAITPRCTLTPSGSIY